MQKRAKKGGRMKGTPNKFTADMKVKLQAIIQDDLLPSIQADIRQLSPSERMRMLTALLRYYMPPLAPENDHSTEPPIILIDSRI